MMERIAVLSDDGRYRFRLDRWWGDGPRVAWIMLNPSTADAEVDDPTIRRCIAFTRSWGYDGLTVVNLYPLRATDPKALRGFEGIASEACAVRNGDEVGRAVADAAITVAAWGVHGAMDGIGDWMRSVIHQSSSRPLYHLGLTKDGHPRHPLYVRGDTAPIPWASPLRAGASA